MQIDKHTVTCSVWTHSRTFSGDKWRIVLQLQDQADVNLSLSGRDRPHRPPASKPGAVLYKTGPCVPPENPSPVPPLFIPPGPPNVPQPPWISALKTTTIVGFCWCRWRPVGWSGAHSVCVCVCCAARYGIVCVFHQGNLGREVTSEWKAGFTVDRIRGVCTRLVIDCEHRWAFIYTNVKRFKR